MVSGSATINVVNLITRKSIWNCRSEQTWLISTYFTAFIAIFCDILAAIIQIFASLEINAVSVETGFKSYIICIAKAPVSGVSNMEHSVALCTLHVCGEVKYQL